MATLTAGADNAVRMDQLDGADLAAGQIVTQTAIRDAVDVGGGLLHSFIGTGFTYDSGGIPMSGQIAEYDLTLNGSLVFKATGASVNAPTLYAAIAHQDVDGIYDLFFGGDDGFAGGAHDDYLDARDGNNIVGGGGGEDTLIAGNGNNHIYGNASGSMQGADDGADTIMVGDGGNYINGNAGNDNIIVGNGNNRVYGGSGDDAIILGDGNNTVNGNIGSDTIVAGSGSNVLRGGAGDDQIDTDATATVNGNVLFGDLGNDQFHTGVGYDLITGGDGADLVLLGGIGSGAAVIGGTTYYDEMTDFRVGTDHLAIRSFVADRVLSAGSPYASLASAQSAAQTQLAASGDAHAVVASQVGQDTVLFFNGTGGSTSIDSFLKLDGVTASSITVASFVDGTSL